MDKVDYIRRIRSIGREVNPDTVIATRALLTPLVQAPDPVNPKALCFSPRMRGSR